MNKLILKKKIWWNPGPKCLWMRPYLEIRSLQMIELRIEWALIQWLVGVPIRREETDTQGEGDVRMEAKACRCDAPTSQATPRAASNASSNTFPKGKAWNRFSPRAFWGIRALLTLSSGTSSLRTWERMCVCCSKLPSLWYFVATALGNQDGTWMRPAPVKHLPGVRGSLQGTQSPEMQTETNKTHCYPWETLKGKKWGRDISGKLHIYIKPHQIMFTAPQKMSPGGCRKWSCGTYAQLTECSFQSQGQWDDFDVRREGTAWKCFPSSGDFCHFTRGLHTSGSASPNSPNQGALTSLTVLKVRMHLT